MGYRSFDRPRTMHKAVCSDCGEECEVPFQPTEGRPVYCRTCWEKHSRVSLFFYLFFSALTIRLTLFSNAVYDVCCKDLSF